VTPTLGSRGIFVALGCSYFITFAAQTLWCIKLLRRAPSSEAAAFPMATPSEKIVNSPPRKLRETQM
jgi:hypothetical protein